MKCPKCNAENPQEASFCMKCGTKLEKICQKCGTKLPQEAEFCFKCGTSVKGELEGGGRKAEGGIIVLPKLEEVHAKLQRSMPQSLAEKLQPATATIEGENRILTVLFGDISSSVAITEKMSPESAADLVNECLKVMVDIVLKYEGSINRFIGDAVLAFFGTPIAHENDPERAILAALEIKEAVSKLNLQISIGINTGMVYVGKMGPDAHREHAAMGTAVNLAARLEGVAKPGQIIVGESTYRPTRKSFEFVPLEKLTLKGISQPVQAYEVIRVRERPEKIRGIEGLRAEMIGRDREFAELKECIDELLNGRGQIISIIGEAGVGKSRLVSELRNADFGLRIEEEEFKKSEIEYSAIRNPQSAILLLEGRCVSIGESIGYWVFIDILRSYLELSAEDSPNDIAEKIVNKMKELFPQRWEDIVPYIGNLLSVKFGNQWDEKVKYLPAEQIKHQTFLTLRDLFLALANQKPLILILEDLHWADNLSLDLLSLLMDELSLAPLMLICVYRPEKEHKSWHISTIASSKCLDRYKEITLRALSPQESRRLIESLLSIANLPEVVKEMILRKSEGNPFFVEEVIRSLIESGMVYKEGDRWIAKSEVEDVTVPDTIQSVIMARIDKLEDEVKHVIQSAAVIGRLFRHKLLQYTTQQERNLDSYLWQLEERDLVYEERAIPELEYSFKHALTQETAYNTILSRRRKEFHRQVAEGYEALYSSRIEEYYEELAYHYSRSDDKEKALHYLVKAGDKCKDAFLNEQAIEYYHQALKTIDDVGATHASPLRGHIYQSLGEIYFSLAKHEEALEYCRKALEYTTDKKQRARIYQTMGWMYERDIKNDLALEHLNLAIAELGDDINSSEMARICIPLFWVTSRRSREEAMEIAQRGLNIVEGTERHFEIVELCICLASAYNNDINKAFEYMRKSVAAAQKSGNSYLIGASTLWLGWVHMQNSEDDVAIKLVGEAIETFEKIGDNFFAGMAYGSIAWIYQKRGDWDKVIECLEHFLKIPSDRAYRFQVSRLAFAYLQKGEFEKAVEYSKKALEAGMSDSINVARSMSVMEKAFVKMGKREEFIAYCNELKERKKGEDVGARHAVPLSLTQWYLEPADVGATHASPLRSTVFVDEFDQPDLKSEWQWVNPKGDCSYNFSSEASWLEVRAVSGSNLYQFNLDAPRLMQEISGNFAVEIKMSRGGSRTAPTSDDLPSVGGLLIWKDEKNYIRFEKGMNGKYEVGLSGNVNGEYNYFGRGMLASEVVYLRIERIGDKISAYCSEDGENWMTCGEVGATHASPPQDPIQVGIHAIGGVGLRGGPMATATRFDYFRVMR